ncbi:MAG: asparagine synthase-related protein [Anaerolineae bacterium]
MERILQAVRSSGNSVVFGFTKEQLSFTSLQTDSLVPVRVAIASFGDKGSLFCAASYGDWVETEDMIALKLGIARSTSGDLLSTQNLLAQGIINAQRIHHDAIRGNILLVCLSKFEPRFCAFKNILSAAQLYYWSSGGTILCSSNLKTLISLIEKLQLNEEALPLHFLYRSIPGNQTYFRNVYRLQPGFLLRWTDGELVLEHLLDLRELAKRTEFYSIDSKAISTFYERIKQVIGSYIEWIEISGHSFGSLLSGGVDSSTMQLLLNECMPPESCLRSFSYAVDVPNFQFEVGYAKEASKIFQTQHSFLPIRAEDYPQLLAKTIDALAQPPGHESIPCHFALAEFIASQGGGVRYLFCGQGADTLHGWENSKLLLHLENLRKFPFLAPGLKLAAKLVAPILPSKAYGARQVAELLPHVNNPLSPHFPGNWEAVFTDLETVYRCFGDLVTQNALEYRRNLETQYLDSAHFVEKIHVILLLGDTHDAIALISQTYLSQGEEVLFPYVDNDIIQATFALSPQIRFFSKGHTKPVLKQILALKTDSQVTRKIKGASGFRDDLFTWMEKGVLQDLLHEIERPGFIDKATFKKKIERPDWFTWNLLLFDLFQKRILRNTLPTHNPKRKAV